MEDYRTLMQLESLIQIGIYCHFQKSSNKSLCKSSMHIASTFLHNTLLLVEKDWIDLCIYDYWR